MKVRHVCCYQTRLEKAEVTCGMKNIIKQGIILNTLKESNLVEVTKFSVSQGISEGP